MQTEYQNSTGKLWIAAANPDNAVHNMYDIYADVGNFFSNTANSSYFICSAIDGSGNQTWTQWCPQIQVDWNESITTALDYIKNKPTSMPPSGPSGGDLTGNYPNPSLATSGVTAGTYTSPSSVVVDAKGRVTSISNVLPLAFSTPTFSSVTTATQLSSTRNAQVIYTFPTSMTSLLASQSLTATLQYADDSGFTTNVVTFSSDVQGCAGILSLVLTGKLQVLGIIPAGKYRKVTLAQTGGATVPTTLSSAQEVLL